MKNILLFTFLLSVSFTLSAQDAAPIDRLNYRVTYELAFQPGTDTSFRKSEKMVLLIGDSTSLFFSRNMYLQDSLTAKLKADKVSKDQLTYSVMSLSKSDFKFNVLKRINSSKIIYQEKIGWDLLAYEEPLTISEWKITNESQQRAGYQCQKATTTYGGRDYEAWFTFEIPLPDGPYKFNGLPGLIVELYDTQDHYHFTLVGLEKVADGIITINQKKLLTVKRSKFDELETEYKEDFIGMMKRTSPNPEKISVKNMEGKEMTSADFKKMFNTKDNRSDNPIELK